MIDININHINNLIIKESSYLLTSLSITRNGSLRYDYFHDIMPFPEFSVFVATKYHCSFSTCHGSCGWLKLLEDADGTCINVDYENIHRFGLWEHALSGFFCWLSGSTHDARILRNSTLYQRAEQGHKLTGPVVDGDGHEIDPYALGYSAYPISPWLQKPFPESTKEWSEIQFNRELSSTKVESAFDRLNSRWRILQKRLDSDIALSVKTAIACGAQFCIKMGDNLGWRWKSWQRRRCKR